VTVTCAVDVVVEVTTSVDVVVSTSVDVVVVVSISVVVVVSTSVAVVVDVATVVVVSVAVVVVVLVAVVVVVLVAVVVVVVVVVTVGAPAARTKKAADPPHVSPLFPAHGVLQFESETCVPAAMLLKQPKIELENIHTIGKPWPAQEVSADSIVRVEELDVVPPSGWKATKHPT